MQDEDKAVNVSAISVHGERYGALTLWLFGAFCFIIGFVIGGYTLPFLRYKPKIEDAASQNQTSIVKNALLVSVGPQTVYVSPIDGDAPISTGLSLERVLNEYEVIASQNGYSTNLEFLAVNGKIEARFSFEPKIQDKNLNNFGTIDKDFPKSLVLTFTASKIPGTIILSEFRKNGENLSIAMAYIDLVKFDGLQPKLSQGQYLSPKGVFEIKPTEAGPAAFIDGKQVFPQVKNLLSGKQEEVNFINSKRPEVLRLVGYEPDKSPIQKRFILVGSGTNAEACTSQAIIIDTERSKTEIIPTPLQTPNVKISNGKNTFILNGFCDANSKANGGQYVINAIYNLQNGTLSQTRNFVPTPIETPKSEENTDTNTTWRKTENRIASPIASGGGLVSVSCRPSGGISISVSGIKAPVSGENSKIKFQSNTAIAIADMHWLAGANSYEINDGNNGAQTKAILQSLKGAGQIAISGESNKINIAAPGSEYISLLVNKCVKATPKTIETKPIKSKAE